MLDYLVHGAGSPFARIWLATSSQSWQGLPTPTDAPVVHAAGPDPDQILLVGSGIAIGYGVVSHGLALGGQLARELSSATGRGATVQTMSGVQLSSATILAALRDVDLRRFDALVLTLGAVETISLLPPQLWRRQLEELIRYVEATTPASFQFCLVEVGETLFGNSAIAQIFYRHTLKIDEQTRLLCEKHQRATFVPFLPARDDSGFPTGRATYQYWAELIAPPIAYALNRGQSRHPSFANEAERQHAVDTLPAKADLDQIVESARGLFGTVGASVTIVDGDVTRTITAKGMPSGAIPRELSICNLTIAGRGAFIVNDTTTDPRLVGSPWADGKQLRFYAGYPVESPDGHRVGALCLVDAAPRSFTEADASLLRDLALRIQSILWG